MARANGFPAAGGSSSAAAEESSRRRSSGNNVYITDTDMAQLQRTHAKSVNRRKSSSFVFPEREGNDVAWSSGDVAREPTRFERLMYALPLVHPEGGFQLKRTFSMLLALLYISVAVPLQIGFELQPGGVWRVFEYALDVFFICDILFNFRTGIVLASGDIDLNPIRVASVYRRSFAFPIDFVTTVPFDTIIELSQGGGPGSGGGDAVRLVRIGKGLKALKMLRLNKLVRGDQAELYEDVMARSSTMRFAMKMTKMLFGMAFLFHWTGCAWHLVARSSVSADPDGANWVDAYFDDDYAVRSSVETDDDGDDFTSQVTTLPLSTRYLTSLYFAVTILTTVGFGDVTPQSDAERGFCFVAMIFGGFFYGFMIGSMSSIVSDMDAAASETNARMERIFSYMLKRNFPPELQGKVKRFFRNLFRERSALDDSTVLDGLPSTLKAEVAHFLIDQSVVRHPGFVGLPKHRLSTLPEVTFPCFYAPDEEIVRVGDEIVELFIIVQGEAVVIPPPPHKPGSLWKKVAEKARRGELSATLRKPSFLDEINSSSGAGVAAARAEAAGGVGSTTWHATHRRKSQGGASPIRRLSQQQANKARLMLEPGASFGEEELLEEDESVTHAWPCSVFAMGRVECVAVGLSALNQAFGVEMDMVREDTRRAVSEGRIRLLSGLSGTKDVSSKRHRASSVTDFGENGRASSFLNLIAAAQAADNLAKRASDDAAPAGVAPAHGTEAPPNRQSPVPPPAELPSLRVPAGATMGSADSATDPRAADDEAPVAAAPGASASALATVAASVDALRGHMDERFVQLDDRIARLTALVEQSVCSRSA